MFRHVPVVPQALSRLGHEAIQTRQLSVTARCEMPGMALQSQATTANEPRLKLERLPTLLKCPSQHLEFVLLTGCSLEGNDQSLKVE